MYKIKHGGCLFIVIIDLIDRLVKFLALWIWIYNWRVNVTICRTKSNLTHSLLNVFRCSPPFHIACPNKSFWDDSTVILMNSWGNLWRFWNQIFVNHYHNVAYQLELHTYSHIYISRNQIYRSESVVQTTLIDVAMLLASTMILFTNFPTI